MRRDSERSRRPGFPVSKEVPVSKIARFFLPAFALGFVAAAALAQADGPVDFGRRAVSEALAAKSLKVAVDIKVTGSGTPESYEIAFSAGKAGITAADANGALYGALELAERIRRRGADALRGPAVAGRPFLRDRGWNLFLTLPWNYAASNTDYDPKALIDPARWWFANDGFWRGLFDEMARARLNWLDIHGTWDISVTDAPNLYAYFIQSDRFPKVGVAPDIKAANLRRLNKIIEMAHDRGIRVSLMAYEARFNTPHTPNPYPENEKDLYDYTREVVEKMIRRAPGLDAIGFRIGESGHGEAFFNSYIDAVNASGRDIPIVTRSWVARKSLIVPLAKKSKDFTVEIKFNGEQWGTPYMVMGGRMAGWFSYSFEDYASDSSVPGAARLWPGNSAPGGGAWPSEPYKLVWQVRANGTNRIFPVYNPHAVRQAVKSMLLGTASGFVIECLETYYPKSPRYYVTDPKDLYCDWTYQRDWMFLNFWGRLGYDPETPDEIFGAMVADRLGPAAAPLTEAWTAASRIVSTAFSAFSLGPDHRQHAVELEWGGDTASYLAAGPFDAHVFKSAKETLAYESIGGLDGRIPPSEASAMLAALAETAAKAGAIPWDSAPPAERKRLRELVTASVQASRLGRYYAERLLSTYRSGQAQMGVAGAAAQASYHMAEAEKAWTELASCSFYKPFTERLRMRTNTFHWSQELPKVREEAARLAGIAAPAADPIRPLPAAKPLPRLSLDIKADAVTMTVPASGVTRAWALVKPLPSTALFHKMAMTLKGDRYEYAFPRENWGHSTAAEVEVDGRLVRTPGWDADAPYLVVPAKTGPTPLIYSSEEAMAYLDPAVLSPKEHGLLLIASQAADFHRYFSIPVQRKILDPVRRGMTLVVLAQNYASNRISNEWLPKPLRMEAKRPGVFDPAGLLRMSKVEDPDILRYICLPSSGWDIAGNGGSASLKWGKGRIIVVNARLIERVHVPAAAASLASILSSGAKNKPVVVVDAGSNPAEHATSIVTDLMNAKGIPFLVLGEVIGMKQGMSAGKPVPGSLDDDSVLGALDLRGSRTVNAYLENKVKKAAALPAPATRAEFEKRRETQFPELFRDLGLDPMPVRTPLNARTTGVLERKGYRIEKIVFESRPSFYVTGHLYVPDGPAGRTYPVIMNPHGHWEWKKQEPTVQSRLIAQALHGYMAFIIDTPGWSYEGDRRIERRVDGPHNDLRYILGSQNATGIYVWDLIRAMDYLETRPEADMTKVGLTGASGGGLATLYAFAADKRYTCAASVVYASSYEDNPNNGCYCNHVPGALRIGDRSDVLALRAPAPILIVGAEDDREFPKEGMLRSGDKLRRLWGLYGKSADAWTRIFAGDHDYNKPMRETVMGFFDKYLKKSGDGSPVPEPVFETVPPDTEELYVLPDPPGGGPTMLDIAKAGFDKVPDKGGAAEYIALNGGLPADVPADIKEHGEFEGRRRVTFVSDKGLTLPALVWAAKGEAKAVAILVSDNGKAGAATEFPIDKLRKAGIMCVALDTRGVGELSGLETRYTTYMGEAPAFGMGWDITRAVAVLAPEGVRIAVVGRGPSSGQAAMAAALIDPKVGFVAGLGTLKEFADAFRDDVPNLAIQPRANHALSLPRLRGLVKAEAVWSFLDESEPGWAESLIRWAGK
jgi:dienelactone hydrolase